MKILVAAFSFLLVLMISSCQKEINIELTRITNDSTAHITQIFKVVQIDALSQGQDSFIRILRTVTINGEKTVIESEIDPVFPGDTVTTIFMYNQQGQLTNIKATTWDNPTTVWSNYQFTWTGNRLTRVVCDTLGQFARSYDFIYTPSGPNTVITVVNIPSFDFIDPVGTQKTKHKVTVNGQFLPIEEQWIGHSSWVQGGVPENYHDTTNIYYSYSGNDLSSYNTYAAGADTTGSGGSITEFYKDTAISVINRSASGINIADTIRKIYGKDVFTLMNFDLLHFDYLPSWTVSRGEEEKIFYSRPFASRFETVRHWENGFFDNLNSYTNRQAKKADNSFDAQGRLIRSDVYEDYGTDIEYIIKVYY